MSIQILEANVIDQIAAGEVVERPAHLVKELVENSLDAGSHRIEIEVSEGGRNLRVVDDGGGMRLADLVLACARHATSKIRTSDDLWSLKTFGFRGEALASIGSVSDLRISSRHSQETNAFSIKCRFGHLSEPAPSGASLGTVVEVRDLFENIPARLKFLKSEVAEISQIKNIIKAMALARPDVEFLFKANTKLQFFYSKAESLLERVSDVLEETDVFYTGHQQENYSVEVVYSSPNTTAKTSRQIWVYVQDRFVVDKTIQAAVMESYRNLLMHGEYPFVVIKILAPPNEVDVNIHPTKSQVKFLEPSRIFKLVHFTLRKDLEKARWIDGMRAKQGAASAENGIDFFSQAPSSVERALGDRKAYPMKFDGKDFDRTQYPAKKLMLELAQERNALWVSEHASVANTVSVSSDVESSLDSLETTPVYHNSSGARITAPPAFWSLLRVVGQIHLTYIVAESQESLFLIDLHAAHERVLFEKLMECYSHSTMDVQNFLIPIAVDVSSEQCEVVLQHAEQLSKIGVSLASGGPQTLLVESAPSWISDKAIVDALVQFAEEVTTRGGSFTWEKKRGDIFATMACHSAIRSGHVMSQEEMISLLEQMDRYTLSSYCPHGRNVYLEIPKTKLERDFGRLV